MRVYRTSFLGYWHKVIGGHPATTSSLKIPPRSHSTRTSTGRQQTVQSVVKHCCARLVSMPTSNDWPQNGQGMSANSSMRENLTAKIGNATRQSTFENYTTRPKFLLGFFFIRRRKELFFETGGQVSATIAVKCLGTRCESGTVAPL